MIIKVTNIMNKSISFGLYRFSFSICFAYSKFFVEKLLKLSFLKISDSIFMIFNEGSCLLSDGISTKHSEVIQRIAIWFQILNERMLFLTIKYHFSFNNWQKLPSGVKPFGVFSLISAKLSKGLCYGIKKTL